MKPKHVIGYSLLVMAMVFSGVMPKIYAGNKDALISLANASAPNGTQEDSFGDLADDPVFKAVIRNGGQIALVTEIDPIADLPDASGLWIPNNGTIEIKTGEYPYEYFTSVLKHEAIHMAQSCSNFAYSLSTPSAPLGLDVTAEGMQDLATYKHSHPAYYRNPVEREAYSNDSKSSEYVANLVDKHCGSKPWIGWLGKIRGRLQLLSTH